MTPSTPGRSDPRKTAIDLLDHGGDPSARDVSSHGSGHDVDVVAERLACECIGLAHLRASRGPMLGVYCCIGCQARVDVDLERANPFGRRRALRAIAPRRAIEEIAALAVRVQRELIAERPPSSRETG